MAAKGANRTVTGFENKPQVRALYSNQVYYLEGKPGKYGSRILHEDLKEEVQLDEAKRYVKRYYVRPLNIFCGNKEDIIQALIRAGDQNCSVYSLKNLTDHEDVHLLQPSDIIYYWDDHVLYDKNHVQVMDYDLFVKHEEERKKVGNIDVGFTQSAGFNVYGNGKQRGVRCFVLDENDPRNYKTYTKTYEQLCDGKLNTPIKDAIWRVVPTTVDMAKPMIAKALADLAAAVALIVIAVKFL